MSAASESVIHDVSICVGILLSSIQNNELCCKKTILLES